MWVRPRRIVGVQPKPPTPVPPEEIAQKNRKLADTASYELLALSYKDYEHDLAQEHAATCVLFGEKLVTCVIIRDPPGPEKPYNFLYVPLEDKLKEYTDSIGCNTLFWMAKPYAKPDDKTDLVWAWTMHPASGRGLVDCFLRADLPDVPQVQGFGSVVTKATRPLNKIRFTGYGYFVPERQFLYMGYPYA